MALGLLPASPSPLFPLPFSDLSHPHTAALPPASGLTHADSLSQFCPTKRHSSFRPQLKPPFTEVFPVPASPGVFMAISTFIIILSCVGICFNSSPSLMTRTVLIQHDIPSVRCNGR